MNKEMCVREEILMITKAIGDTDTKAYLEGIDAETSYIYKKIRLLVERGFLEKLGRGFGTNNNVYRLTKDGEYAITGLNKNNMLIRRWYGWLRHQDNFIDTGTLLTVDNPRKINDLSGRVIPFHSEIDGMYVSGSSIFVFVIDKVNTRKSLEIRLNEIASSLATYFNESYTVSFYANTIDELNLNWCKENKIRIYSEGAE